MGHAPWRHEAGYAALLASLPYPDADRVVRVASYDLSKELDDATYARLTIAWPGRVQHAPHLVLEGLARILEQGAE